MRKRIGGLILTAAALVGCGGGAGSGSGGNAAPVVVDGAFSGSYTAGQDVTPFPMLGAFSPDGSGFLADADSDLWVLPAFSSNGSLSGNATAVFSCDCGLDSGQFPVVATASGNPASSVSGSFTNSIANTGVGFSGNFSVSSSPVQPLSLTGLAGTYSGYESPRFETPLQLTISPTGQISTLNTGCAISGTASIESGSLLQVGIEETPPSDVCFGSLNGIGFISSIDFYGMSQVFGDPGPFLYLGVYNSTNGMLLELAKQ